MIKPEQIPDEVVKAALEAWKKDTETFHPNAGTIAAALNAWPGAERIYRSEDEKLFTVILHLTQEKTDV